MMRYYFDLLDGDVIAVDEEGMEFPDLAAAQAEAARSLANMVRDAALDLAQDGVSLAVEVRDGNGPVLRVTHVGENSRQH